MSVRPPVVEPGRVRCPRTFVIGGPIVSIMAIRVSAESGVRYDPRPTGRDDLVGRGPLVNGIAWSCPRCRGALEPGAGRWTCRGCGAVLPGLAGHPRPADGRRPLPRERRRLGVRPDARRRLRPARLPGPARPLFRTLARDHARPEAPADHAHPDRPRAGATLGRALGDSRRGPVLDLGCGTGSFLAAAGRELPDVGGVDIAMRWLLVARKRLDEEGLGRVPLACACAEGLPLRGRQRSRASWPGT